MHGITIVTRADLSRARTTGLSYRRVHPDWPFVVVVLDARPGEFESDDLVITTPDELDIDLDEFRRTALLRSAPELADALTPWAIRTMLDGGAEAVVYLSPDTMVYGHLDEIEATARKSGLVLVPYATEPYDDDFRPNAEDLMSLGLFDPGLVAFGADSMPMLDWWCALVRRTAHQEQPGPSFAQCIDLVPAYFEHAVLRGSEYNVSYRNLDTRPISKERGEILVSGKPLRTFRFGGYDPSRPWVLNREVADNPRVLLSERPVVRELCEGYAQSLNHEIAKAPPQAEYLYSRLEDGTPVDVGLRDVYRHLLRGPDAPPPVPFAGHDQDLVDWLRAEVRPQSPVSRFLYSVWEFRPDVRSTYADPLGADETGFMEWAQANMGSDSHLVGAFCTASSVPSQPSPIKEVDARGVNLAGYFRAEFGLGEMARLIAESVDSCRLPHTTVTAVRTLSRQDAPFEARESEVRYPVTIAAVNADVYLTWAHEVDPSYLQGRYVAAVWAWEVEEYPEYRTEISMVDEIWTLSEFAKHAIARRTDKPVHVIPLPIRPPADAEPIDLQSLGLPRQPYFLFAFDYFSIVERKNPFAVIEAFKLAFPNADGPILVLKTINGEMRRPDRERVRFACLGRPDIYLLETYLDGSAVGGLMAGALAYTSLHRAEGFGLTIAESMARGRPVIATAYSGNLEFMDADNSLLVPYTKVTVAPGSGPYPTSTHWAEPDVEVAAKHMRWVYENPDEANALGLRGRKSVLGRFTIDRTSAFIDARVEEMLATHAMRVAASRRPRIARAVRRVLSQARSARNLRP